MPNGNRRPTKAPSRTRRLLSPENIKKLLARSGNNSIKARKRAVSVLEEIAANSQEELEPLRLILEERRRLAEEAAAREAPEAGSAVLEEQRLPLQAVPVNPAAASQEQGRLPLFLPRIDLSKNPLQPSGKIPGNLPRNNDPLSPLVKPRGGAKTRRTRKAKKSRKYLRR